MIHDLFTNGTGCLLFQKQLAQIQGIELCDFQLNVSSYAAMKAEHNTVTVLDDGSIRLVLEPDILSLGKYLADKYGLSLETFIEVLITDHASKGKLTATVLLGA